MTRQGSDLFTIVRQIYKDQRSPYPGTSQHERSIESKHVTPYKPHIPVHSIQPKMLIIIVHLSQIRATLRRRRLSLQPGFSDFDKKQEGHVTVGQLQRVLCSYGVLPDQKALAVLTKRYATETPWSRVTCPPPRVLFRIFFPLPPLK